MSAIDNEKYQKLQILKRNQIRMIQDRGYMIPKNEIPILEESLPLDQFIQIINPENETRKDYENFFISMKQIYQRGSTEDHSQEDDLSEEVEMEHLYVIYVIGGKDFKKPEIDDIKIDISDHDQGLKGKLRSCVLISDEDIELQKIKDFGTLSPIRTVDLPSDDLFAKFNLNNRKMIFQHFNAREIRRRIVDHNLQNKYTALTEKEGREFLNRVSLLPSQLQRFKYVDILLQSGESNRKSDAVTDPIVKYYGWRPGQIVRIDGNVNSMTFKATYIGDSLIDHTINYRIVGY